MSWPGHAVEDLAAPLQCDDYSSQVNAKNLLKNLLALSKKRVPDAVPLRLACTHFLLCS